MEYLSISTWILIMRIVDLGIISTVAAEGTCRPTMEGDGSNPTRDTFKAATDRRRELLKDYNKDSLNCPEVIMVVLPLRMDLDFTMNHASIAIGMFMTWVDPFFKAPAEESLDSMFFSVREMDVWVPSIMTAHRQSMMETFQPEDRFVWLSVPSGRMVTYRTASVLALCEQIRPEDFPRDGLNCSFSVLGPSPGNHPEESFHLDEHLSQLHTCHDYAEGDCLMPMERVVGWKVGSFSSKVVDGRGMEVEIRLLRQVGQFESVIEYPAPVLSVLLLSSTLLSATDMSRAILLATAMVLNFFQLIYLSFWMQGFSATAPRLVLLYSESILLMGVAMLQWLLSRSLAARNKPLASWLQPTTRMLLVLRRPMLIQTEPASPPDKAANGRAFNQESFDLAKVLDRLTFLALTACYIGIMSVQLP